MGIKTELENYFDRLFPLCRSLTGKGVRDTLQIIRELIPIEIKEVPSGTPAFDWIVPKEWVVRDAYIVTPGGKRMACFKENNLHLISYSVPFSGDISYNELLKHLHFIPEMPDAIPYKTTYYNENWGFCLSYNDFLKLDKNGRYSVFIDTELIHGSMTYGEYCIKGKTEKEILFSTYICHPSMANNELSGILTTAFLARELSKKGPFRFTYRFLFVPETIGSIYYLSENKDRLKNNLYAGLVLSCIGDNASFSYKKSRDQESRINSIIQRVLTKNNLGSKIVPFSPIGSDERQYCSPGFNLPVGVLSRSMFHQYKEYHTSLDNKSIISLEALSENLDLLQDVVKELEESECYITLNPFCEPQLGKRGLYPGIGGMRKHEKDFLRMMYLLNYSDGMHDLSEIACMTNDTKETYRELVDKLVTGKLLKRVL